MFPFNLTGLLGGAIVALLLGSVSTGLIVHKMDQAAYTTLQLADAAAQTKAVTKAKNIQATQDATAETDAIAEATAQQKIVTQTQTITKEVLIHVPDTAHCITYGLVRVFDAAALDRSVADIKVAPGKPDDACAPVSWRALASDITDDYGTGHANAEQLNALEADVRALNQAAE